jgi:hypothetical protein
VKKKFITSKGSIELEYNVLFIKNRKVYFQETGFARITWNGLPVVLLILVFFMSYEPFRFYTHLVLYGIWTIDRLPSLYKLIFKTSFSKRIPLENIAAVEVKEDANGLETQVLLFLKNKRVRTVTFRKLENQYEAFLSNLPLQSSIVGLA